MGKARALTCRFATTLLAMAGGCLLVAVVRTQALVLAVTVMTGVMNAAAFGTSLQYFSLFPPQCGGYYFMGASLSSLATIGLTFASGFQRDDPSEAIFATFYSGAGVFVLAGLAAVLVLMYSPIGMHYMAVGEARAAAHAARAARRMQMRKLSAAAALEPAPHAAGGGGEAGVPLLGAAADDVSGDTLAVPLAPPLHRGAGSFDADADTDADGDDGVGGDSGEHAAAAAASSPMAILRSTAACHVALGLCWACTTAVDGLLDVVPTSQSSASGQRTFRLLLLYASLLGELSGKQLNVVRVGGWGVAKTPTTLLVAVAVRALAALAALLYVMQPRLTASGGYALRVDGLAVAFQAFFDCTGAYLSSVAYTIASKQLAAPSLRARSAVMLGFTVTVGVYAGLGVAYAVASIARAFTS